MPCFRFFNSIKYCMLDDADSPIQLVWPKITRHDLNLLYVRRKSSPKFVLRPNKYYVFTGGISYWMRTLSKPSTIAIINFAKRLLKWFRFQKFSVLKFYVFPTLQLVQLYVRAKTQTNETLNNSSICVRFKSISICNTSLCGFATRTEDLHWRISWCRKIALQQSILFYTISIAFVPKWRWT